MRKKSQQLKKSKTRWYYASSNYHQRVVILHECSNATHATVCVTPIPCMRGQKLLLEELYQTRMCNSLLVPEADEDLHWTGDKASWMTHNKAEPLG